MAVLPVVKFPNKVLKTRASEVTRVTPEDRKLVKNMIDTMYAENGVGLAANQVGVLRRIFVASHDQIEGNEQVYFNPKTPTQSRHLRRKTNRVSHIWPANRAGDDIQKQAR